LVNNYLGRLWQQYQDTSGLERELLSFALCLLLGLLVMPCLIFLVGHLALGPYTHGGVLALWSDYLRGLASGSMAFWCIALGPYAALWLLRAGRRLLS
jgi:hypothetical protein